MKVLILDGARPGETAVAEVGTALAERLRAAGHEAELIPLREKRIGPCLGCFACWLKTPGLCVQTDDEEEVLRAHLGSEVQVWLTPVVFGGYSAELKKALDRSMPLALPFFEIRQGEIHHPDRYEHEPAVVVLGVLPTAEAESEGIFGRLVERNMHNYDPKAAAAGVVRLDQPEETAGRVAELFGQVGVSI